MTGPVVDTNAAALPEGLVVQHAELGFFHSQEGWKNTGVSLETGDAVTVLGDGSVNLGLPVPAEASLFLWARIGKNGPATNVAGSEYTFTADRDGELYVAVRPAGVYWTDRRGTFPQNFGDVPKYPVDANVEIVKWSGDAASSLTRAADTGASRWRSALSSYAEAPKLPEGFEYLWYLGQSAIFEAYRSHNRRGIRGLPSNDAGIIRKTVDIPLDESTTISFDWRYESLPAKGPETEARFHDYLSVAVEFDNGQDITWFWSEHLEEGTEFTCPLPWWDARETHVVIQSGLEGLGKWHSHLRPVQQDYSSAVGGEMPSRIVGIWFINSGVFGDQDGEAYFANVVIKGKSGEVEVFSND